ncbi:hypothetical protein PCANC_19994 [Puccinia coronata f. sp. avenae]|uniref:Uncharacterized protein n=2 Tax=Puccinia coronata f. sp. avenae TaxID=200324 RepID=A0A2N5SQ10_9BASI|nr:hypothetical protein PCANC_19994 [Puccinia coronata f. sp. avenae]
MFLYSLAFVTSGVEDQMGSEDGSEPEDLLVVTRQARLTLFDQANEEEEEDLGAIDWENLIFEIHENIHEASGHGNHEDQSLERAQNSKCFPFKSQQHLLGSLIIGYMRHIMSRVEYGQLRMLLSVVNVDLPHWNGLRFGRLRIRRLLKIDIDFRESVLHNECYVINLKQMISHELANPFVHPHLDFYPIFSGGKNVFKMSQSFKWREDLSPDLRVQMVDCSNKHWYIFEPVELKSRHIVVPLYFFMEDNKLMARCVKADIQIQSEASRKIKIFIPSKVAFSSTEMKSVDVRDFSLNYAQINLNQYGSLAQACSYKLHEHGNSTHIFPLPNPWRTKAKGMIIRHVPINLYADDTSGNVSKQFNKHMVYYFTLSGLPPRVANMEYNCHFLCTSKTAGALELADQIVDQMNELATEAVMSVVLCFQGDSPMHAEITSTPVPGVALHACRMCTLKAASTKDRKSASYVLQFLGRNAQGSEEPQVLQDWNSIKSKSKLLWIIGKEQTSKQFDDSTAEHGIRDCITCQLVENIRGPEKDDWKKEIDKLEKDNINQEKLFNPFLRLKGFDGCKDTPVEILHVFSLGVIKYMTRDFMQSLTTKKLDQMRHWWAAVNLNGLNIPTINPNYIIKHFKSLVGKDFKMVVQVAPFIFFKFMTPAQRDHWHSLCILSTLVFTNHIENMGRYLEDVRNLFATEKFESFNGIMRLASVHSNRHSPGRDIAISFVNFQSIRLILSGAQLINHQSGQTFHAQPDVTNLFKYNHMI